MPEMKRCMQQAARSAEKCRNKQNRALQQVEIVCFKMNTSEQFHLQSGVAIIMLYQLPEPILNFSDFKDTTSLWTSGTLSLSLYSLDLVHLFFAINNTSFSSDLLFHLSPLTMKPPGPPPHQRHQPSTNPQPVDILHIFPGKGQRNILL